MAGYLSWQYGNDSNSGTAANAPKLTWASLDGTIGNDEIIYVQKTEKPLVMDSEGNPAYLKFTNNSTSVVIQTSSSIHAGSPATDTSFDDSIWDYSNSMALDFIASQYDDTNNLPGQAYSQSVWYGVKSVSNGVITLNDEWYSSDEETSTITDRAVYASGSYDVNSSATSLNDSNRAYLYGDNGCVIIGGCTYDGSSTWTEPATDVDDESVMRNTNNHSAINTVDGTMFYINACYGSQYKNLTFFNFNYGFYAVYARNCIFRNFKFAFCDYSFYWSRSRNCLIDTLIISQCAQIYSYGSGDMLINRFYNFGNPATTSYINGSGAYIYDSHHLRFDNYLSAGKYYGAFVRAAGSNRDIVFNKPKTVNPFNAGGSSATFYAGIYMQNANDTALNDIFIYKPSGWKDNPGGSVYGLYTANVQFQQGSNIYPRHSNPIIRIVSGSNGEHERSYYLNMDTSTGNDNELGYIERSGSGYLNQGQSIAFHPKWGGSADSDDLTSGVYGLDTYNAGYKYSIPKSGSGDPNPWRGAPMSIPFEFPVSESSKLKVSFFAKDDSSFDGNFSQVFTGTFYTTDQYSNYITGSISQSVLTTSWKQYHTISPPVPENTVLTCHFLCSGSQGQAALDQISASYE